MEIPYFRLEEKIDSNGSPGIIKDTFNAEKLLLNVGRRVWSEKEDFMYGLERIIKHQQEYINEFLESNEGKNIERISEIKSFDSLSNLSGLASFDDRKAKDLFTSDYLSSKGIKSSLISRLFTLYSAINLTKPDRILAIATSAIPLAGIIESWGYSVDKIGIHRETKSDLRKVPYNGIIEYSGTLPFNKDPKAS